MLTEAYDVVDGKRVRMARLGSGPPLVLLHGYPDTLQIWSALAPLLAARFDVIAFDWPGIGGSEAWSGGATPFDLARRIVRLLDHWQLTRATVAGHDMGGQAALALAATDPARVERIIVMNSLVMPSDRTSWEIDLLRRFRINSLLLRHFPRLVFHRALSTSVSELPAEVRAELWRHFQRRGARDFIVRMCAGYEGTLPKLETLYGQIRTPLQIVWGERDRHFPLAQGQRLHERIPGSTLDVIPGAGHWMVWDRVAEVAEAIINDQPIDGAFRPTAPAANPPGNWRRRDS
ncbi:MAG TPA: alpha/beta hydrolase [Thermoanaerobaculia bacterium]|jgi:pimeloyl-ACP methyl ester carboxylesterase|nr:alpha/beta hydrolase [Thermoanaerobaculia bacterium]